MSKVKIYTTPTCVFCLPAKKLLEQRGVEYEEIDVSQDEQILAELKEKTGQMGVPVIEIGQETVVGFDQKKIIELLERADLGESE